MKKTELFYLFIFCLLTISGGCSFGAGSDEDAKDVYIDSVIVENNNIFPTDSAKYDYWLFKVANKLHAKTRKFVIDRELLQGKGDIFSRELADETERNLRALPFISTARVELLRADEPADIMKITTSDVWTLSGGLSVDRTASQTTYQLFLQESNLLGMGQLFSFNYFFRDFDEDYAKFLFSEKRLLGSRLFLDLIYDDDPEAGIKGIIIGKPFHSLNSKVKYRAICASLKRRDDYYSDGNIIARDDVAGESLSLDASYRFGTYHSKLATGLEIVYKDTRVSNKIVSAGYESIQFPKDSLYYSLIPEFEIGNYRYIKTTRINGFKRLEDFLIAKAGTIKFGWYLHPRRFTRFLNKVEVSHMFSSNFKSNLLFLNFGWERWFDGNTSFRKQLNISIRYYNNSLSWLTEVVSFVYDEDIRRDSLAIVYVGEDNGVRGYPKNYSTGEKRFVANVENRFFPGIEFFSANLGAVQFLDMGKSWSEEESFKIDDILWSLGVGIRVGVEKFSSAKTIRIDLAYAGKTKEWQVSFGLGQYIL